MNLLSTVLQADPATPRLTLYDETTGARLDFSGITLDNWAAKVANMLREELDMEEGSTIACVLPVSWQAVVIVLGAMAAGVNVTFDPSDPAAEVTFIATQINSLVFTKPSEVFGILGLTYFVLCFGLSRIAFWMEKRLERKGLGTRRVEKVAA